MTYWNAQGALPLKRRVHNAPWWRAPFRFLDLVSACTRIDDLDTSFREPAARDRHDITAATFGRYYMYTRSYRMWYYLIRVAQHGFVPQQLLISADVFRIMSFKIWDFFRVMQWYQCFIEYLWLFIISSWFIKRVTLRLFAYFLKMHLFASYLLTTMMR